MVEGAQVKFKVISLNKYSRLAISLLPFPVAKLCFDLNAKDTNSIVQSILSGKYQISLSLFEFTKPAIPRLIANKIQRMVGVKDLIAIPLLHEGRAIGSIVYASTFPDQFVHELSLLQAFADSITKIIVRHLSLETAE